MRLRCRENWCVFFFFFRRFRRQRNRKTHFSFSPSLLDLLPPSKKKKKKSRLQVLLHRLRREVRLREVRVLEEGDRRRGLLRWGRGLLRRGLLLRHRVPVQGHVRRCDVLKKKVMKRRKDGEMF